MALKFKIHAGLSIEHRSSSGMRNMVQLANHAKISKLAKTFQPAKIAKGPSTPRLFKILVRKPVVKKAWRTWPLGVPGGLKRLGELPSLGAPGENLVYFCQNKYREIHFPHVQGLAPQRGHFKGYLERQASWTSMSSMLAMETIHAKTSAIS
jgi:hypothetical protein